MIPSVKLLPNLFVLIICGLSAAKSQENLLDFNHSLRFARYLTASAQYNLASDELERINFLWPGDTSVILELVKSYRLGDRCDKIKASFDLLSSEDRIFKIPDYSREFLMFSLQCRYCEPVYFKVSSALPKEQNAFYHTAYFWMNSKYDSLSYINRKYGGLLMNSYPELYKLGVDFEKLHYKKPGLAVFMSALIPGSGKAYSKNWGDALVSLLIIGTNSYASYRAFRKKGIKSGNGWIFGSLAVSFYFANLWGSHKAAVKYNNDLNLQYQKNAESVIFGHF
jgi:hypothetical protein